MTNEAKRAALKPIVAEAIYQWLKGGDEGVEGYVDTMSDGNLDHVCVDGYFDLEALAGHLIDEGWI